MSRRRRLQDAYGRKARAEGFAARSVYKLQEIDKRVGLFRKGQRVLDLGAAPGSWTQYAATRVGPAGRVLGYDLEAATVALPASARIERGDVRELLASASDAGRMYDVVMSDMAPRTSGHRDLDQARSYDLFVLALEVADRVVVPSGSFVGKLFQGGDFEQARRQVAERFEVVRVIRPQATRSESIEVFLVGLNSRLAGSL